MEEIMRNRRKMTRRMVAALSLWLIAVLVAACGSSSPASSGGSSGTTSGSGTTDGPGLTQPTNPSGTRVSGGTVYFTEGSDATPNYIFPLYSPQVCSTTNFNQLMVMLYRPLYWYGNNYRPTVDYDYSVGERPVFSNGNTTVTITLKPWKWSDGETVTSRDLVFWMNLLKAEPATEWCGYVPGLFPDNVTSYSAPNPQTFVMHLRRGYNPEWFIYNELSQLTPLPLAWDRTSLSQPAPTSDNGHLPDATRAGAAAVYKFLDAQSRKLGSWASSPLWSVVDGPFKLDSFTTDGEVTLVPNPDYSGSPKPSISRFVELPFTSETSIYNEIRSGGPSAITIGNVPSQYAPQIGTLVSEGYVDNDAASYSFSYFPLNWNSSAPTSPGGEPVRYIFRQLYFRQAFQHLIDQPGWATAFLDRTAIPTYSPLPPTPPSPLVDSSVVSDNPYPFSTSAAAALLKANGWDVKPGGTTTCVKPGAAPGDCGAGIAQGEGISFNIDYQSGVVSVEDEMNDLAAQAKRVGIDVSLTTHPFDIVIGTAVACQPSQLTCRWTAQDWGAGWIYGPDYLPSGETLFTPGAVANYGSYGDPKATRLIDETLTAPASAEKQLLTAYAKYLAQSLPVVYQPTEIGTFGGYATTLVDKRVGGYAANALGFLTPEAWYFTR
jgi:peptide/nickel transport system substrate-binding protein